MVSRRWEKLFALRLTFVSCHFRSIYRWMAAWIGSYCRVILGLSMIPAGECWHSFDQPISPLARTRVVLPLTLYSNASPCFKRQYGRALHAQLPYTHSGVLADIVRLVSNPREEVARIRADNLNQAWAHFSRFVQLEAEAFGEHSFFAGIMEGSVLSSAAEGTLEPEGRPGLIFMPSHSAAGGQAGWSSALTTGRTHLAQTTNG